jgi:hypothetical protein
MALARVQAKLIPARQGFAYYFPGKNMLMKERGIVGVFFLHLLVLATAHSPPKVECMAALVVGLRLLVHISVNMGAMSCLGTTPSSLNLWGFRCGMETS